MYCKLFASLYQGTLRGRTNEILVFTCLLAHADQHGCVDRHFNAVADDVGISVEAVKEAILNLEAVDPESRSQDAGGARLTRLDAHRAWGWQVVNYLKYRDIRSENERREQNRLYQQSSRERKILSAMSDSVSTCQQMSALSAHTEAEAEAEAEADIIPLSPSPAQIMVASWFNRRPTTPWTAKELKTWKQIEQNSDDLKLLNWFYAESGNKYLRRDLSTLLNNWQGELDRARGEQTKTKQQAKSTILHL